MSYHECRSGDLVTIRLVCDARKGKGVCENEAEVTMQDKKRVQQFLFNLGWRLMRGHHVCGSCMRKYPKISFPRKNAVTA